MIFFTFKAQLAFFIHFLPFLTFLVAFSLWFKVVFVQLPGSRFYSWESAPMDLGDTGTTRSAGTTGLVMNIFNICIRWTFYLRIYSYSCLVMKFIFVLHWPAISSYHYVVHGLQVKCHWSTWYPKMHFLKNTLCPVCVLCCTTSLVCGI